MQLRRKVLSSLVSMLFVREVLIRGQTHSFLPYRNQEDDYAVFLLLSDCYPHRLALKPLLDNLTFVFHNTLSIYKHKMYCDQMHIEMPTFLISMPSKISINTPEYFMKNLDGIHFFVKKFKFMLSYACIIFNQ